VIGYVGSFSFWCDFVSTICFLLEIDIVYKHRFDSIKNVIQLNQYGFPDPGQFSVATNTENASLRTQDYGLVFLIFKTARVARLVPPTKVVDLSKRINLFWYLTRLTPCFYWKLFLERRAGAKRVKKNPTMIHRSWGSLEIAALATLGARKEKKKNMKQRGKVAYAGYTIKKWAETSELKGVSLQLSF